MLCGDGDEALPNIDPSYYDSHFTPHNSTQAREDAVARKSVLLPMYSLMVLGQRSIPANVPRVREKIERVVREVVNTRNGILTPFMAVALGEVILELNRAFATLATPYTKFTPGTRIHRAHKNQRKHLVMALRALRQHVDATQDIYRRHGNSFADVTDDEKRDKLAATFIHAAYREYKHVAFVAYFHLLTANIRYVWHDPYHMQGEPKFDPRSSRFMKTMAFYGRLFLKAGRRAFNKSAKDAEIPALAMKRLGSVEDVRGSRARMASWWRQVKSRVHAWWSKVRGKDMHGETSSSRRASMDVVDNRLPWFERKLDLDSYARQYPMDQFPGVFPSEPALRNTRPRSAAEDVNGQVLASSGSDAAAAAAATATVPEQPRQEGDELHELEDDAVSAPPPSEPQAPSTASRHREVFRATVPAERRAARDGTGSSGDHDA